MFVDTVPARRNRKAVLTVGPSFDTETKALNCRLKPAVPWRGIDPYDQNTGRGEEVQKPVQRSLKGFDRMLAPPDQNNVVSTTGKFAARGGYDMRIAAVTQLNSPAAFL